MKKNCIFFSSLVRPPSPEALIKHTTFGGVTRHGQSQRFTSGFTILEVTVAMFIFGCVLTAVLHFMVQGDKINGRRVALSAASMAASNQIELLRRQEESSTITEDTAYDETINGVALKVQRSRVKPENGKLDELNSFYNEYSLLVFRASNDTPLVHLRLLQGMRQTYGKVK